jgi:hypothetical protein
MSILFDQDAAAAKFSDAIKTGLAEAQAAGIAAEDHLPGVLIPLIHQTLLEASTDVSGAIAPLLPRIDALNSTLALALAESTRWRTIFERLALIFERLNLSPSTIPKQGG